MSIWDSEIFRNDAVLEFFDEVQDLDVDERQDALIDAGRIALGSDSEDDRLVGLAAAVVAAIWSGAPFSSAGIVEDYSFVREGVNDGGAGAKLAEVAAEVFESLSTTVSDSTKENLEDFAEAVE